MFQKVSNEFIGQKKNKQNQTGIVKRFIMNNFTVSNMIIYILSLCVSTISINEEMMPFGMAMLVACCGSAVPMGIVFLLTIIGSFIGMGFDGMLTYLGMAVVFTALVMLKAPRVSIDERNEINLVSGHLIASICIVQAVKMIFGTFLIYDVFATFMQVALTFIFYKIFVNAIPVIQDFKNDSAFTVEELFSVSILFAIGFSAFSWVNVFNISLSNIFCIFLILLLGWKNGILVGATSGLIMGLILGVVGEIEILQITSFAISGMFAGILNRFGKIGVIIGFTIGNVAITYIANGNTDIVIYFREIFIATIGLLFVPNQVKIDIEELKEKNNLLPNTGEMRLEEGKNIAEKLNSVSETIENMAQKYSEVAQNIKLEAKVEKETFVKEFKEALQEYSENIFSEDLIENDEEIIKDIYELICNEESFDKDSFIKIFESKNKYIAKSNDTICKNIEEIVNLANKIYRMNEVDNLCKRNSAETRETVSKQLSDVSKVISSIAQNIDTVVTNESKAECDKIQKILKAKDLVTKSVTIKECDNQKKLVTVTFDSNNKLVREKERIRSVEESVGKVINEKVSFQREVIEDDRYIQIYESADKYVLKVATAKTLKNGSKISGDSSLQLRLDDGKYLVVLSDGMGTNEKAKDSSQMAVNMLSKMLKNGVDNKVSLDLINSAVKLGTNDEMYATIDMAIFDLYKSKVNFIKRGSCDTILKNKKSIRKVTSNSLPIGILDNIENLSQEIEVEDGDTIIMCSDGIFDSSENESWLEDFIKKINTTNVQKIADLILDEAVDNGFGIAKDDMTVIVCKVMKKSK